ncbi:MAG: hypothetical protein NUW01_18390 [Gemmatimonadaceae bacterium]|nr:hypothetical protein [Gemmatimonadaceae bacterium]
MTSWTEAPVRRKPKAKAVPVYPCAVCGREITAAQAVYSKFTGRRFCSPAIGHLKRRKAVAS